MTRHVIYEWPEWLLADVLVDRTLCHSFRSAGKIRRLDDKRGHLPRFNSHLSGRKAGPKKKKR